MAGSLQQQNSFFPLIPFVIDIIPFVIDIIPFAIDDNHR
jgi:hypothetical protein